MNKQRLKKTIRLVRDLKKDYQIQIENYRTDYLSKLEYKIKPKIEAWKALLAIGFTPVKILSIFKRIT